MIFLQRMEALAQLGKSLEKWIAEGHPDIEQAYLHNNWFTESNIILAFRAWRHQLSASQLQKWTDAYDFNEGDPKTIAIIMAGNIPLVGLHDLVCVLLSGNRAIVKLSSDDTVLMKLVINELIAIQPELSGYISISEDRLPKTFDAVIATGSNNSNRYFEYYFRDKPHLLRKSRSSVAVLTGNETPEDFEKLGQDIFSYFGLGCRNISKLYVPEGYEFPVFFEGIESNQPLINHNKYANNYFYHKAIFLMNLTIHLDNGFLLLKEDDRIASPLSVLFYQEYQQLTDLNREFAEKEAEIQCIAGKTGGYIPLGKSQMPELWDYADGVDTLNFCLASGISGN